MGTMMLKLIIVGLFVLLVFGYIYHECIYVDYDRELREAAYERARFDHMYWHYRRQFEKIEKQNEDEF